LTRRAYETLDGKSEQSRNLEDLGVDGKLMDPNNVVGECELDSSVSVVSSFERIVNLRIP
jgi:hypothetical protein